MFFWWGNNQHRPGKLANGPTDWATVGVANDAGVETAYCKTSGRNLRSAMSKGAHDKPKNEEAP